jgi:hypothetical protein
MKSKIGLIIFTSSLLVILLNVFFVYGAEKITLVENKVVSEEPISFYPGPFRNVEGDNQLGYGSYFNILTLLNIEDKTNPQFITTYTLTENIRDIALKEHYVFLALDTKMQAIDVTNPTLPQLLDSHTVTDVNAIFIQGTTAFVGAEDVVDIVDITDPSNLQIISRISLSPTHPNSTVYPEISENHLFVFNTARNTVWVYDIVDLNLPILITTWRIGDFDIDILPNRIMSIDNACGQTCNMHFSIFSIDPTNWDDPILIGGAVRPNSNYGRVVEAQDMYAYVGLDVGLDIYNVYGTDPVLGTIPEYITHYDIGDVYDIVIQDDYVYAAAGGFYILERPPLFRQYLPVVFSR